MKKLMLIEDKHPSGKDKSTYFLTQTHLLVGYLP